MTQQNETKNQPPVYKDNKHGVHYDVWRKNGKYGSFYEVERYKPYQDKAGNWQKSHMLSDRDLLVAKEMEPKVLKEIGRLQDLDREVAARYKDQHSQASQQQQSLLKGEQNQAAPSDNRNMDAVTLQEAKEEALANKEYQNPDQQHDRPHEPSR